MAERTLTDEDIKAIAAAVRDGDHPCRFTDEEIKGMQEAAEFVQHFNSVMRESGSVFRKTIIVFGVSGLATIIVTGLIVKVKQLIGP